MIRPVSFLLLAAVLCSNCENRTEHSAAIPCDEPLPCPSEYVSTLVGTQSDYTLSAGNTYPAVALPWGMNFWTPQTGKMGDGWIYTYGSHTIRGLKQTHQPSPWINDYGQFSIMPVRGKDKVNEESRQSWFSHQSEEARPYYYAVYLADHDIKAEIAPTERAAIMRFTFPESDESGVVIDAFDRGSYIRVMHDRRTVVGYSTRNSGGVPENFKNWFIVRFDRKIRDFQIYDGEKPVGGEQLVGEHALVRVGFETRRGEQVTARAASSFISQMQAVQNLEELGKDDFETVKDKAQARWDEVLGKIEVTGGTTDQYRTFYSCLYRSTLFPPQVLRDRQERQYLALQPLQRRGAAGLHVHRHGVLGHLPEPLPAAELRLSFGQRRDSGGPCQCLPRERLPARMGLARTSRMHGGQQLGIGHFGCHS